MVDIATIDYDEILAETEMAILFLIDDEEKWIPKSQIHNDPEGSGGEVEVSEWFAIKEELV